jgi:hypothetical protein
MEGTDRKRWSTPRLKILVRLRTEEGVLTGCKYVTGTGPGVVFGDCRLRPSSYYCSSRCDTQAQS